MRAAIVYDRVNKWGGAERVLLALHELFPEADLFTSVYDIEKASWAKVFPNVIPSFLQKLPLAKNNHEYFAPLMPLAFESLNLSNYDLIISVTSEAAKGIRTYPHQIHINYLLTPTRYLWSGHKEYFENKPLYKALLPIIYYLRSWDKSASKNPDHMIAISEEVKKRAQKYYGRKLDIIYPPVTKLKEKANKERKEQYLLVSRLVSYKKVDLAIKAFNDLCLPLLIVGEGREEKVLRKLASGNIHFLGRLTDEELANYYEESLALIFPQLEDFGIVPVEAQYFGLPVIAYAQGGALETVKEGETGVFFYDQSKEGIIDAIGKFQKMKFDESKIIKNAEKFSKERFKNEFLNYIKNVKRV